MNEKPKAITTLDELKTFIWLCLYHGYNWTFIRQHITDNAFLAPMNINIREAYDLVTEISHKDFTVPPNKLN